MTGKSARYPYGSTGPVRMEVLGVLGVLKVATADQIQRMTRPHLTYRYGEADKDQRNKSHRNAALDLAVHGQTVSEGNTGAGHKLWGLTTLGLESASRVLDRPMEEMGGIARGTGTHGAAHAMAVNETVIAFLQARPDPAALERFPEQALAAAQVVPEGIGTLDCWSTEIGLPASGTWSTPGKGGARADAVLLAPEAGVPLLFVEVDCGNMTAEKIADKFAKYQRFFRRQVKDTDGTDTPMWRTRWTAPPLADPHEVIHPPILLVLTGAGPRGLRQKIGRVSDLSRACWQSTKGEWSDYRSYHDTIPVLATTLERLQELGPLGPTFWRYGHNDWEPLHQALADPDDYHAWQAGAGERRAQEEREQALKAAEREKHRPVCTRCGTKFTDERWEALENCWGLDRPELCEECEDQVDAEERAQTEAQRAAEDEAARAAEAAQEEAERRGGRLFGRFR